MLANIGADFKYFPDWYKFGEVCYNKRELIDSTEQTPHFRLVETFDAFSFENGYLNKFLTTELGYAANY